MTTDGAVENAEVDTCRICSAPAEEGQPLFYPCKCSGTIRYIHQDCLTTWLAHSKKRTCDVCKYEYGFTKVYKPDMPKRLPPKLFLRKLALQLARVVITSLRLVMISIIWLAILPYLTLLVWRFYFWTGEALAYWVVGKDIPNRSPPPLPPLQPINATDADQPAENVTSIPSGSFEHTLSNVFPHDLGADIFKGQVITIAVVIVFLTIFLLREWIIQNARPGVFGDEDVPEAAPVQEGPPANVNIVPQPLVEAEAVDEEVLPMLEPIVPLDPPAEPMPIIDVVEEDDEPSSDSEPYETSPDSQEHSADEFSDEEGRSTDELSNDDVSSTISKGKGKEKAPEEIAVPASPTEDDSMDIDEDVFETDVQEPELVEETHPALPLSETGVPSVAASAVSSRFGNDVSLPSSFAFSSPLANSQPLTHSIESSLDGTQSAGSQIYSSSSSDATQSQFQSSVADYPFTFSVPPTPSQDTPPAGPLPGPTPTTFFGAPASTSSSAGQASTVSPTQNYEPTPLPYPLTSLAVPPPPPRASGARMIMKLPRSNLPPKHMAASTPALDKNKTEFDEFRFSFSSTPPTLSQNSSRQSSRPPLPPSTPGVDEPLPVAESGTSSPGVALYRPPEDIVKGYFERSTKASSSRAGQPQELEQEANPGPSAELLGEIEEIIARARVRPGEQTAPILPDPIMDARQEAELIERVGQVVARLEAPPAPGLVEEEDDAEDDPQDAEPMGDDDMDGALEAIGMRGPITSVFQNVFLMIFIIDLAIAVGIWMPFTMGKTTALLFLQPEDVLTIIRFPIIAVRVMTDPIVDGLLFLLNLLLRPLKWGAGSVIPMAAPLAKKVATVHEAPKSGLNFTVVQNAIFHHWDRLLAHSQAAVDASVPRPSPTNAVERLVFRLPAPSVQSLEGVESRFAALGRAVRLFSHAFARRWRQLALADGTSERAFAITLGYMVLCVVMGVYLGVLNAGAVRGAARALRNAVKQQLIVVKVALFIGLELLVFPTGCGVVLDIATLPLFDSASLAGRIAFYDFAPLTAFFCHWLVGTIFMYQFALTLGACRTVMRPGAMWFIKDPQDASFSPIRDILDKRVLTQLRKLAVSAIMYTVVIVVAIGSVVYTLRFAPVFSGVLPLRGNMREPLSEIPVDLLFLHLVVPPTVKRLTLSSWIRARLEEWWKFTARQLRLSSFMFGKLYADELQAGSSGLRPMEEPVAGWTIPEEGEMFGRWLRVPKGDNIAFLRDEPVLIEVDRAGVAVRERGQEVMELQDQETRRAGRQPDQDYTIVHVPPMFGARCMLLVILLWITAAAVVVTGTAGPILLGRFLLAQTTGKTHVHDGYALAIGWYVLWGTWRLERAMRAGSIHAWGAVVWFANVVWLGLGMGVVMPALVAMAVEVYVILPLRVWWNPGLVPVVRVVEEWALGLVLMKIGWQTWRMRMRARGAAGGAAGGANPEPVANPIVAEAPQADEEEPEEMDKRVEELGRAMEQILRNGLTRPDAVAATRSFIGPVCGGLVLVIGAPAVGLWVLERALPGAERWGSDALLTVVYPGIFCGASVVGLWRAASRAGRQWVQGVRDDEFLVERRLRNLESAGR